MLACCEGAASMESHTVFEQLARIDLHSMLITRLACSASMLSWPDDDQHVYCAELQGRLRPIKHADVLELRASVANEKASLQSGYKEVNKLLGQLNAAGV